MAVRQTCLREEYVYTTQCGAGLVVDLLSECSLLVNVHATEVELKGRVKGHRRSAVRRALFFVCCLNFETL